MDNSIYLFAAFAATWTVIFIYVFRLFRRQAALSSQLDKIKRMLEEKTL